MAKMALSGEEGVETGAQLAPSKHAHKEGAQEIFLPLLEKCFGRSLKLLDIVQKSWAPLRTLRPPSISSIHSLQSHMSCPLRLA